MTKHTEGPWSTQPESQITGGTYEILTKDGQPVASVWPGALGADVVPANAHLIASAPELLEACKVAYDALKQYRAGVTDYSETASYSRAKALEACDKFEYTKNRLGEVIAKAEGKE